MTRPSGWTCHLTARGATTQTRSSKAEASVAVDAVKQAVDSHKTEAATALGAVKEDLDTHKSAAQAVLEEHKANASSAIDSVAQALDAHKTSASTALDAVKDVGARAPTDISTFLRVGASHSGRADARDAAGTTQCKKYVAICLALDSCMVTKGRGLRHGRSARGAVEARGAPDS